MKLQINTTILLVTVFSSTLLAAGPQSSSGAMLAIAQDGATTPVPSIPAAADMASYYQGRWEECLSQLAHLQAKYDVRLKAYGDLESQKKALEAENSKLKAQVEALIKAKEECEAKLHTANSKVTTLNAQLVIQQENYHSSNHQAISYILFKLPIKTTTEKGLDRTVYVDETPIVLSQEPVQLVRIPNVFQSSQVTIKHNKQLGTVVLQPGRVSTIELTSQFIALTQK